MRAAAHRWASVTLSAKFEEGLRKAPVRVDVKQGQETLGDQPDVFSDQHQGANAHQQYKNTLNDLKKCHRTKNFPLAAMGVMLSSRWGAFLPGSTTTRRVSRPGFWGDGACDGCPALRASYLRDWRPAVGGVSRSPRSSRNADDQTCDRAVSNHASPPAFWCQQDTDASPASDGTTGSD